MGAPAWHGGTRSPIALAKDADWGMEAMGPSTPLAHLGAVIGATLREVLAADGNHQGELRCACPG